MSKQCLDVHQMQHLQELGLELDYNTMLSWIVDDRGKDKPLLCISSEAVDYVDFRHYCLPAYTLQDVLDALPSRITHHGCYYYLSIAKRNLAYVLYAKYGSILLNQSKQKTLIDAAHDMLCWTIENKFVETNKNE